MWVVCIGKQKINLSIEFAGQSVAESGKIESETELPVIEES